MTEAEIDSKLRKNVEIDASKLLISNIKKIHQKRTETLHSRESELKNKTKDSQEYSYGADLRKMEPKIIEYPQGKVKYI